MAGGGAANAALPPLRACNGPTQAYEARICADKDLRSLPLALERLLWMARGRLSAQGRAVLAAGQASWRDFLPMICPVLPKGRRLTTADHVCITRGYASRIVTVLASGVRRGPYVLQPVETLSTTQRPDLPSRAGLPYAMHVVSYPRIDQPGSPAALAWNTQMKRGFPAGAGCDEQQVDTALEYDLGLVTPRLIGLSWNAWVRCDPADVGTARRMSENWVLTQPPRRLAPADLFRAGASWQERLAGAAEQVVTAAAKQKGYAALDVNRERIAAAAVDPERWVLRTDGIGFVFSELEIGVGATFLPRVTVPWAQLKDLLTPGTIPGTS